MNSKGWNQYGWAKLKNPSGEIVRTKTYTRYLCSFINAMPDCIKTRKQLAEMLEIPDNDLMGDLKITIDITKHKHTTREYNLKKYRRYLKR